MAPQSCQGRGYIRERDLLIYQFQAKEPFFFFFFFFRGHTCSIWKFPG